MLFIFLISLKSKIRLLQDSCMGQTSVGRLDGRLDVLRTSFPPPPSWIQDGGAGNDVNQDLGRPFRPLSRSEEQDGGPSASGGHLGWPHLRNREWGHPRWPLEAEGPPSCSSLLNGGRKGRPILLCPLSVLRNDRKCNYTFMFRK